MGMVWIASYPKSGNTWMRFLLANYLAGPIHKSADVEALIPGISHVEQAERLLKERSSLFGKTHHPWGPDLPCKDQTERAVIIVRHPKDVLLSNLNYQHMLKGHDRGFKDEFYARTFIALGCDPRWHRVGYGTLEHHARSWIEAGKSVPTLMLRYEDLKADTASHFRKVVEFLGLPVDEERIQTATERSSFEQMRALEVREKQAADPNGVFHGPKPRPGWARYFMQSGQSGSKLANINPQLDAEFDQRFAAVVRMLGYSS